MHTQEIACPNCGKRTWINVPDPPQPGSMAYIFGTASSFTRCSQCRINIRVDVGYSGEIKRIVAVNS